MVWYYFILWVLIPQEIWYYIILRNQIPYHMVYGIPSNILQPQSQAFNLEYPPTLDETQVPSSHSIHSLLQIYNTLLGCVPPSFTPFYYNQKDEDLGETCEHCLNKSILITQICDQKGLRRIQLQKSLIATQCYNIVNF